MRKLALGSCLLWPWVAAALPCGSVAPLSSYIGATSCTAHGILFDGRSYLSGLGNHRCRHYGLPAQG